MSGNLRIKVETQDNNVFYHVATDIEFDGLLLKINSIPGIHDGWKDEVCYPETNICRFTISTREAANA